MVKRMAADGVWVFDARDGVAATRLRREIVGFLRRNAHRVDDSASELILGELLGNVVKHTPGLAEVSLACGAGESRLVVRDRGPGFVDSESLPQDLFAEAGRGMFLVHALSRSVVIDAAPGGGAQVAVDLPLKEAAAFDALSA